MYFKKGQPNVVKFCSFMANDTNSLKVLAIIAAAESSSEHSLGISIVKYAKSLFKTDILGFCSKFSSTPGCGLTAIVSRVHNLAEDIKISNSNDVFIRCTPDFEMSLDKKLGKI